MKNEITTIPLVRIPSDLPCDIPDEIPKYISEDEPAIKVMTDFTVVVPKTVRPYVSLDDALEIMKTEGVRLLLVKDKNGRITGIITAYDIQGEIPITYARETGISHDKITVRMIMTPLEKEPAFHMDFVERSLVRHVITTMRQLEKYHVLVVAGKDNESMRIHGLFSAAQINRSLGKRIHDLVYSAHSFAEIQKKLSH